MPKGVANNRFNLTTKGRQSMTDTERTLYRKYLSSLTERELFTERETVERQAELSDPGMILAVNQEVTRRRNEQMELYKNLFRLFKKFSN